MKTSCISSCFLNVGSNTWLIFGFLFIFILNGSIAQTIITSGTTVKVNSGTSVNSSDQITLQSGSTLNNQGTVILKKNLVNQNVSANSLGTGAFMFSGSTSQSITGQNVIQDVTLNNPTGLVIGGDTRVNGVFTLTNGVVSTGAYNLLLGPSASFAGTPSSTNMVVATGAGQLRKEFTGGFTGSFTYPVGDATSTAEYSPVTLNFSSGTFGSGNYAGVNLVNSQFPGTSVNYLNRYWNITQSNITNFSCVATFQYVPADVVGDESNMYCFRVDPIPFTAYNKANTGAHTIEAHGIGSFSTFTGNRGNSLLPPEIHMVGGVNVSGQTLCFDAQQTLVIAGNGTTFTVQSDGIVNLVAGQKISMLPGTKVYLGGYLHGYITQSGQYCTVPSNPVVFNQGEAKTAEATGIGTSIAGSVKIYPNPTTGKFVLELSDEYTGAEVSATIYGIHGERIFSQDLTGNKKHEFTLAGRPVGVYFVKVIGRGEVSTTKLILTH